MKVTNIYLIFICFIVIGATSKGEYSNLNINKYINIIFRSKQ